MHKLFTIIAVTLTLAYPVEDTSAYGISCGIKPIAPVVQTGCSSMVAQCVCNSNGQCWWEWYCI